jgi:uncharacterized protein
MVTEEVIQTAVHRLVDQFHPLRIILFGSYARGTAGERSDVDLLVICPIAENRKSLTRSMDRSLRGLKLPRDIIVLTPDEFERDRHIPGTIARPASKEGKVLYEHSES